MKNNIGIVKAFLSESLRNGYMNNTLNESKSVAKKFYDILKESEILKKQFVVYKNIESKHIDNDTLATRYIDENISLFENYTRSEVLNETKKLRQFHINGFECDKKDLYEAIDTLILQSTQNNSYVDVNTIHESFVKVLNHIKNNKSNEINESKEVNFDYKHISTEQVIGLALNKFNQKYDNLDEREKKLLQVLTLGNKKDKFNIFETLKKENLQLLEEMDSNGYADKITETINKIEKMETDDNVIAENTISLYELRKSLT